MKEMVKNSILALFVVMALMAAGCSKKSGASDEGGALNNAERLVIGYNPNYYPVMVAHEKGLFKDEFGDSLDVEIVLFVNGPAQNEALLAKRIDIANMGDLPVIQLWANDAEIQIISYLWNLGSYSLVANKRSGIQSLADLKGKQIATQFGSNGHKVALKFIASQGLEVHDVEMVNLQRAESIIAMKQGAVDSAILLEPSLSEALKDDNLVEISTSLGYDQTFAVTLARTEYAKKNPQIVSRYLKVINQTNNWIAQNPDEATQLVLKSMGSVDFDGTKKYYTGRNWVVATDQNLIDWLNDTIQFCRDQELITRDDLDAKNLVNDAYVKGAGL